MNLIKERALKEKMLESNPNFMEERFDSGIERANEARRRLEEYFDVIQTQPADDEIVRQIEDASKSLSLGLNHAAFTYNPHSPDQVETLNMIMRDANKMVQFYGEDLNTVIHNYPYVSQAFDHIYDIQEDYYATDEGIKYQQQMQQEPAPEYSPENKPNNRPDPSPSGPSLSM